MFPTVASAGAFLQPPGEGVVITGGAFTGAVRSYDVRGRLVPIAPWRKFELSTYAEYGVTDWLTVIATPSLFVFRQLPPGQSRSATGIAETGARVRLFEWDASVLSAQVTVRAPLAGQSARPFADTTRFAQVDARLAWGRGFELFDRRAFTDLQIGARSFGNFGHEARVDATLGIYPIDPLLLLFQSFTVVAPGRSGRPVYLQQKLLVSGVYWVTPRIGVQAGVQVATRGVNSAAERGAFSALWVRF